MKALEKVIHNTGRFAFGIGLGIALVCAYVIVSSAPALDATPVVRPADVRLDPVVVTIPAERFDAIRAEERGSSMLVRTPERKAGEG